MSPPSLVLYRCKEEKTPRGVQFRYFIMVHLLIFILAQLLCTPFCNPRMLWRTYKCILFQAKLSSEADKIPQVRVQKFLKYIPNFLKCSKLVFITFFCEYMVFFCKPTGVLIILDRFIFSEIIFNNLTQPTTLTFPTGIFRDKTIADKLIYIPNDDIQNFPFCRLQLLVKNFVHST